MRNPELAKSRIVFLQCSDVPHVRIVFHCFYLIDDDMKYATTLPVTVGEGFYCLGMIHVVAYELFLSQMALLICRDGNVLSINIWRAEYLLSMAVSFLEKMI